MTQVIQAEKNLAEALLNADVDTINKARKNLEIAR